MDAPVPVKPVAVAGALPAAAGITSAERLMEDWELPSWIKYEDDKEPMDPARREQEARDQKAPRQPTHAQDGDVQGEGPLSIVRFLPARR